MTTEIVTKEVKKAGKKAAKTAEREQKKLVSIRTRGLEVLRLRFNGVTPLLQHNVRLANPLDPYAKRLKQLTSQKNKTEEAHEDVQRAEFEGGLYCDEKIGPYLPTMSMRASILEAGAINKLKAPMQRALLVFDLKAPLIYDGPRTPEGLWAAGEKFVDVRAAVVNGTRTIMRTRPKFEEWACEIELHYDPMMLEEEQIVVSAELAGRFYGLGDFRPGSGGGMFGRYEVEVIK